MSKDWIKYVDQRIDFWSKIGGIDTFFKPLSYHDKCSLALLLDNQVAYAPDDNLHNEDLKAIVSYVFGQNGIGTFEKEQSYGSGVLIAVCTAFSYFKSLGACIYVPLKPLFDIKDKKGIIMENVTLKNNMFLFSDKIDNAIDENSIPFIAVNTMFVNNSGIIGTVGNIFKVDKRSKFLREFGYSPK